MSLKGRHALVTGGGRGIGRAIALALKEAGAAVTITGRSRETLSAAVADGAANGFLVADATDEQATADVCRWASEARGPIDIFVANAGAAETAPFLKSDAALFQRMLDVNLMGTVHGVRAVLPSMLERGQGRIIAVASTAGLKGYAYVSAYTAAKHALVGFTRALALETAGTGVTVNALCPGYTQTDMVDTSLDTITRKTGRSRKDVLATLLKDSPLQRLITPEEVASACLWLASDGASAVTGAAIPVAGGEV
jgi:3-hydroxybutyrate dehydrogenase